MHVILQLLYAAVKAFSAFGSLALDRHRALTVSLATSGMELTDTLELRSDSSLQSLQLPSLPTKVFVYATGAGCATVQVTERVPELQCEHYNSIILNRCSHTALSLF
jgi:hypothetical protein